MIISAELQENPLITINNIRKINKFSKTPIIFLLPNKQLNLTEIDDNVLFFYKPFLSKQIVDTLKRLLGRSKSVLQDNIIKFKNIK
ncbi:hypothetical protein [Candidatus Rickettsia kedanie]|uniref:Response regulatory domain-containing protein n=1 Tax=Candidatus Rickettsia kedanie TaxID=3115352 RepID=A0ABP9TWJ5_9RICK